MQAVGFFLTIFMALSCRTSPTKDSWCFAEQSADSLLGQNRYDSSLAPEVTEKDEKELLGGLIDQRDSYLEYYAKEEKDERALKLSENIDFLISRIQDDNRCVSNKRSTALIEDPIDSGYEIIGLAILAFKNLGYKLSAELLSYSVNPNLNTAYSPMYAGRVFSSEVFKNVAEGSVKNGSGVFSGESDRVYAKDLHYAINAFSFQKSSEESRQVTILDTYDFHEGGAPENFVVSFGNDVMYHLQQQGYIKPFDVEFSFDYSRRIDVQRVPSQDSNDLKCYRVTNHTSEKRLFVYNKKYAFFDDVFKWCSLTDISYFELESGRSCYVSIGKNGNADHFAFSYTSSSTRVIFEGVDTPNSNGPSIGLNTVHSREFYGIELIGKNSNRWLFSYFNSYNETMKLEFNSKMCFLDDAKNWSNLYDIKSENVYPGDRIVFSIEENFAADYVCFRASSRSSIRYYYADQLDASCTMRLWTSVQPIRCFLKLGIKRKYFGSWDIDVTNTCSKHIIVDYNTKMCNDADAKTWTNLNDVKRVNLDTRKTTTVRVYENWFATTVAFSYVLDGVRLISYGNHLDGNGSISVFNVAI